MKKLLFLICGLLFTHVSMADTINLHWLNEDGTIYQNSTCAVGNDLEIPSTPPTKYGYTFTGWKLLPYTPIEYLESTGIQYIDTGILPSQTLMIQTKVTPYTDYIIFGSRISESQAFLSSFNSTFGLILDYGSGSGLGDGYARIVTGNYIPNTTYDLEFGNRYIKNLSSGQILVSGNDVVFAQIEYPIYLLGLDSNGLFSASNKSGAMYYLKIYDSDVLVRDFIPVLDKNGVPCMYDRVTQQFFYNQGTGQFTAGPVLQ